MSALMLTAGIDDPDVGALGRTCDYAYRYGLRRFGRIALEAHTVARVFGKTYPYPSVVSTRRELVGECQRIRLSASRICGQGSFDNAA